MTLETVQTFPATSSAGKNSLKPLAACALVGEADLLFYGHPPGISVLIFALTLAALSITTNPIVASRRIIALAFFMLFISLLPIIEDRSLLSEMFAALGVAAFALMMTSTLSGSFHGRTRRTAHLLIAGPGQLLSSLAGIQAPGDAKGKISSRANALIVWIVPLTFGCVFLWLFAAANPVMEALVAHFDLQRLLTEVSVARVLFWLAAAALTWPFVAMRPRAARSRPAVMAGSSKPASVLFGDASILRSLILFNGLFALQTTMDIGFLWGGIALPNGMTYAAYAHRGAYPIMVTALLAGGFVIAAMQPGSTASQSRLMRMLVLVWIAQNVMLVVSSILRLDLYVAVYSLTMWRIAAFIWMGLVAAGLVWLIVRIALNLSNRWLIDVNLATAMAVLYACCFVNFPRVIAEYNVSNVHIGAECPAFDKIYISSLGPEVIPVIDTLKTKDGDRCLVDSYLYSRTSLAHSHHSLMANWRAWTFRGWRLEQYLRGNGG